MKKIKFLTLALLFFIDTNSYAAPCYGTSMPEQYKWNWGFSSNFLAERKLKDGEGEIRSYQYFVLGSFGVTNWFCLDGKIGFGDIKQSPPYDEKIEYGTSFAGGYGFRLKIYENQTWDLRSTVGFHHISVHPHSKIIDGVKNRGVLDDWQGEIIVSKRIKNFVPYIGCEISRIDYIHWRDDLRKRKKSDVEAGLVAGIDIYVTKNIFLNVESKFFDEKSLSADVVIIF